MSTIQEVKLAKNLEDLTTAMYKYIDEMEINEIADIAQITKQPNRQQGIIIAVKAIIDDPKFLNQRCVEVVFDEGYTKFKKRENYLLIQKKEQNEKLKRSKKTER